MKIMITGGYDESMAETPEGRVIIEFTKKLAEQVILQNHQLRSGNLSSLDELVIVSACDAAEHRNLDADKVVISYHPKGHSPRTSRGGVNSSAIEHWNSMDGRRLAVPELVDQADVLILLGGYGDASGTFTAANWARQIGTPILPIATFTMAAGEIFLILTDSVDSGFNPAHDTMPIQNPATFLHSNRKNKTDVGIFIQVLFENLKIVQWVAGLTYHQPYRLPKAC